MLDKDLQLLESAFKKYYFDHFDLIHVPERTSEREFGYQKFNSGMNRHLPIKSDEELRIMLITNIPSDVYCSNAYYSFPNLPMNEKDWKEADLIFDVDSKDLNLDCRKDHSCIKCLSCSEVALSQKTCPNCKSTKIEEKSFTCLNCVTAAKNEITKLITILTEDLDVSKKNIHVYFSGNEGFHVYVKNSNFQKLGSRERSELVDYLMFRGAIPETFGMKKFNSNRSSFPEFDERGWRGRVSRQLFGTKSKRSKGITEIISNGYTTFQHRLENMKDTLGVKIDPSVTMDVHRIFRLAGSLNSKSGLTKIFCDDIEKFNPFRDACFIDDEKTEVFANCPITFTLKNKKFGPYEKEKVTVPKFAAIYLICKGFANSV
ncbi:MAG: DNA primase small subunit domain-containing protein [Nitrosopumilaceae archaeon]|jgi:DNA primase small subunit